MKPYYLITIFLVFSCHSVLSQNVLDKLKEFYENADFECYENKIQKDLKIYDSLITKALPKLENKPHVPVRPAYVDLSKMNKIFVLAIALANTESYTFDDDIYNYIIIDSLRSFIIVCVDDKMNVIGITDTEEPGSYVDTKDNFYFPNRRTRKWIKNTIKTINKKDPELIMYCSSWWPSFMYIKHDKIYVYYNGYGIEFNEIVRRSIDVTFVKNCSKMIIPPSKTWEFSDTTYNSFYRYTGHTPKDEVRICPPLRH